MILIECDQGTEAWHNARLGVITASRFRDACDRFTDTPEKINKKTGVVTPPCRGEPSEKSRRYAAQVAVERVSRQPEDGGFVSWQMRRGTELEPAARLAYETATGNMVQEAGVILTDDRIFGYSTDGFIEDEGAVEIKCVVGPEKLLIVWRDNDLSEYMHQMQGGLWITGRRWIDFVMYAPQLEPVGKSLYIRRVFRDEEFIETMERDLMEFLRRVEVNEAALRADVPLLMAA